MPRWASQSSRGGTTQSMSVRRGRETIPTERITGASRLSALLCFLVQDRLSCNDMLVRSSWRDTQQPDAFYPSDFPVGREFGC